MTLVSDALHRLMRADPRSLQQLLVENYMGNILQDCFDACDLRRTVPGLPDDTEDRLRIEDAHKIAQALFAALPGSPLPVGPARVQTALAELVAHIAPGARTRL